MARMNLRSFGDERGLVGKILVVGLLVVALVGVAALDAGRIVLLRLRTDDLAGDASAAAADAYAETGEERSATLAALAAIAGSDDRARLRRIDIRRGDVLVVVTARADTFVVGELPFLDDVAKVTVSASAPT